MLCRYCQNAQGLQRKARRSARWSDPVGARAVADRVLHERVGGDDEVAREPRPHEQGHGHREVTEPAESLLAEEEEPEERGLEDEGEHPLDGEGLAHDLAGVPGEAGPVRPELEFERDARHDAHGEIEREDPRPEPRDLVVRLFADVAAPRTLKMTMRSASPIVSCGNR